MKVICLRGCMLDGKPLVEGREYDIDDADARLLSGMGKVEAAPQKEKRTRKASDERETR